MQYSNLKYVKHLAQIVHFLFGYSQNNGNISINLFYFWNLSQILLHAVVDFTV